MKASDINKWRHDHQVVPLQIAPAVRSELLTNAKYRRRDTVELFHEAKLYVRGRLQINSREMAIAILLSRDTQEENNANFESRSLAACAGV